MPDNKMELNGVKLPEESREFLKSFQNNILAINPFLTQNCFVCEIIVNIKKMEKKDVPFLYMKLKDDRIKDTMLCQGELMDIAKILNERTEKLAGYFSEHSRYRFKPYNKMMIGEGGGLYLNMQPMKLHPLFGLPFIPASAIKGALRSAWVMEEWENDVTRETQDQDFITLFGGAETEEDQRMGELVFFDIFPERFFLSLDVQTPHYKDYYELKGNPSDDQNLKPIPFVCLEECEFQIIIACRDKKLWLQYENKIKHLMNNVFTQLGIGGKGALGYGIV